MWWTNDGKFLIFQTDKEGYDALMSYNFETKEIKRFGSKKLDETFGCYAKGTDSIIVHRENGLYRQLVSYDLTNQAEKILELPKGFLGVDKNVIDGSKLIVTHSNSNHRMRFLLYDLQTLSYEEILPADNGKFDEERDFHHAQSITYSSTNDANIEAMLYAPKGMKEGEKLPAIIVPHGGPTDNYYDNFMEDAQIFTDNG